jgi:hypothetical protein
VSLRERERDVQRKIRLVYYFSHTPLCIINTTTITKYIRQEKRKQIPQIVNPRNWELLILA